MTPVKSPAIPGPFKVQMCIRDRPMSVEQALLVGCNNISEVKWQDKHHLLAVEWDSVFEVTDAVSYTHLTMHQKPAVA